MTSESGQSWNEAVHNAASDWWSRMRAPDAEQSRPAFERWLGANPRHRAAYSALQDKWILSEGLADSEMGQNRSLERIRSPFRATTARVAMAAAAVAAILLVAVLRPGGWFPAPAPTQFASIMRTMVGEIRTVELPDGSKVTLDTDSQVRVRFAGDARRVALVRGRARFEVQEDAARSFIVQAGGTQIIAPPGRFDAALFPQGVSLWAWRGALDIRSSDVQLRPAVLFRLVPGQNAVFAPDRNLAPKASMSDKASDQWVVGMLVFKSRPLSEVLAQTNRYSRQQIVLGSAPLGQLRVTGTFRPLPVNALAASLAAAFGLQMRTDANGNLVLLPG